MPWDKVDEELASWFTPAVAREPLQRERRLDRMIARSRSSLDVTTQEGVEMLRCVQRRIPGGLRYIPLDVWLWANFKVNRQGCWVWQLACDKRGYAQITAGGAQRKPVRISGHRLAYAFVVGPIPAGMAVCHACNNLKCINPSHLYQASPGENNTDAARDGLHGKRAKLTVDEVRAIRLEHKPGTNNYVELMKKYKVSKGTIHSVVARRTWRHVE